MSGEISPGPPPPKAYRNARARGKVTSKPINYLSIYVPTGVGAGGRADLLLLVRGGRGTHHTLLLQPVPQ